MKELILFGFITILFSIPAIGQDMVAACQQQVQAKQYETAVATCQQAANTNALYGNMGLGVAYSALMKWDNAITALSAAISANNRAAQLYIYRGNAYYNYGDYRSAVFDLERAATLEPKLAASLSKLISHSRDMAELVPPKKPTPSVERRSLEISLAANSLLIERSMKLLNKEPQANIDELDVKVNKLLDDALKVDRYNGHAYAERGALYNAQNKKDLAVFEYSKAIAVAPDSTSYRISRAEIYKQLKNYSFALADLTKVIEIKPNDSDPYIKRSSVYDEMGNADLALADLAAVIANSPKDDLGYSMRASFLMKHGDLDKAFADLNTMLTIAPKNAFGLSMRCEYFNKRSNFTAALKDCTTAIEQNSLFTSDGAQLERVTTYIGLKRYALAFANITAQEKKDTFAKDTLLVKRGLVLKAQGKKADAVAALKAALAENPLNEDAKTLLKQLQP